MVTEELMVEPIEAGDSGYQVPGHGGKPSGGRDAQFSASHDSALDRAF
jgi:hypothetical protein